MVDVTQKGRPQDKQPNEVSGVDFKEVQVPLTAWDDIANMRNEKNLIEKKILLPLLNPDLARKHSVTPPKAILLFGPPGTGKTIFAKGIAGKLGWSFVEINLSELTVEGFHAGAHRLEELFNKLNKMNRAVIFFDEFEEIALRPDRADKTERMFSSEMLRQIPRLREGKDIILVCATNNIRLLSPALLRPGRFDYILPVGPLSHESRKEVFEKYLKNLNLGEVNLDLVVENAKNYTPADIQAVCVNVAQMAFENELTLGSDYRVTTADLIQAIEHHKATVSEEDLKQFHQDSIEFSRVALAAPTPVTLKTKCHSCGREIDSDFALCPYCGASVKVACPDCGKVVSPDFIICPYCGSKLKRT